MKNLCIRIIIMMIGVNFTGTMTTPSRKSSIFFNSQCQWNGYSLSNCSFTGEHDKPVNVSQKASPMDVSSNFFRVLLQSPRGKKEQNIKRLDLRNNPVLKSNLSPLVHLHALETLNLSNNALHSVALDLPSPESSDVKHYRGSLIRGFPFLKVLILQRNKLSDVPKGLWKLKSLQSLDLSFNEISKIALSDFHNCLQLENLYLSNNKIFRIHPGAFKSLKKLQVVDLSHNALATILPMMLIALELPHLEIDLAGNQWQCDCSVTVFQNVLSESWRQKWKGICKRSTGNEEACWGTSPLRIPRETPMNGNPTKSSPGRRRAQAPMRPAEEPLQGPDLVGPSRALELHRRRPRDVVGASLALETRDTGSPDLALAVCLSVFITFFLAFGLGALARPYLERLCPGRCRRKKPPPDLAYFNEGFYDEVAGSIRQHPRPARHAGPHAGNLTQNHNPFPGRDSNKYVVPGDSRVETRSAEPGHQQHREPVGVPVDGASAAAGSRGQEALAKDSASPRVLQGQASGSPDSLISAVHVHTPRSDGAGESVYDMVAWEESLTEQPSAQPGTVQTVSDSVPINWTELHSAALCREPVVPVTVGLSQNKAPRAGERAPGEDTQLPPAASQEPVYLNLSSTRQREPQQSHAGLASSPYYSGITANDVGAAFPSPPLRRPRRGSVQCAMPADPEPGQRQATPGTRYDPGSNYDSDEGSLFTLSSSDSEGARSGGEEEIDQEESSRVSDQKEKARASEDEDSRVRMESQEDHAFQAILQDAENHEVPLEEPHVSHADSDLSQAQVESAADTKVGEDPWTPPRSRHCSGDEIPGRLRDTARWRYSLKDLMLSDGDPAPHTPPPCFADSPSDSDLSVSHARGPDSLQYELDTVPNDRTFKITWDSLGSSQLSFSLRPGPRPGPDTAAGTRPWTPPRSRHCSGDEIPGRLPDTARWRYSLKDLMLSDGDPAPHTPPPCFADSPSDSDLSASHARGPDSLQYELDTVPNDRTFKITWDSLGSSQLSFSLRPGPRPGPNTAAGTRPWTPPRSRHSSGDEIPGRLRDTAMWRYSLKDLMLSDGDPAPHTPPPCFADSPSDSDLSVSHARGPDSLQYELDTVPNDRTFKITWDSLGSSQLSFSLRPGPHPGPDTAAGTRPWTPPRSRHSSSGDEIPGRLRETEVWRYSLKDLMLSDGDPAPHTPPPCFADSPSDSDLSASHARGPDSLQYELDTVPNDRTFKITWDSLRSSQLSFSLRPGPRPGPDTAAGTRPWTPPRSRHSSGDEIPGRLRDTEVWRYSLKDLMLSDGDPAPHTPPPCFADSPSDSDLSASHARGPDSLQYELDTVPNDRTFKITWDSLRSSQLSFSLRPGPRPGPDTAAGTRPWTPPRSRHSSGDEIPGRLRETEVWRYSLKDLMLSDGDPAPHTPPPCFADSPSDSDLSVSHARGPDSLQYELDTVPNDRTFKITWDSLRSSQLSFSLRPGPRPGPDTAAGTRPWTPPRSRHSSGDEIPGRLRDTEVWRYSLKDLMLSDGDPAPHTPPPCFADSPSDSDLSASHARGPDSLQYELDTVPNDRTFKITWDSLGSSQLAFEEGADTSEEFV